MRRRFSVLIVLATMAVAMTMQWTAGAAGANAATLCHKYQAFSYQNVPQRGTLCAAPSKDYPAYKGWGRVVSSFPANSTPSTNPCVFSIFPPEITDAVVRCAQPAVTGVQAWAWNASTQTWKSKKLDPGTRVYIYPFSGSWRWAWTQDTGWVAMDQQYLALRWFVAG